MISMMDAVKERLHMLRDVLRAEKLDAVVVTKVVNLHYFSGFRGDDTALVVTRKKALLITDNRLRSRLASRHRCTRWSSSGTVCSRRQPSAWPDSA